MQNLEEISKIELPTKPIQNIEDNPRLLILYGMPKVGKTTKVAELKDCLIIDLAKEIDYLKNVNAFGIKITSLIDLMKLGELIKQNNKPYKYISIDHIGVLEEWSHELALQYYKRSSLGKGFTGKSVLELSHGAGYYWLRKAFMDLVKSIETWAEYVIFVGHVKEKIIGEKAGTEIASLDLELTGKLNKIFMAYADSTGFIYRKTVSVERGKVVQELWISFKASAELSAGSRVEHLKGKDMKFEWGKIYV